MYLSWSRTLSCQVRVGGQWCDAMTPPHHPGVPPPLPPVHVVPPHHLTKGPPA